MYCDEKNMTEFNENNMKVMIFFSEPKNKNDVYGLKQGRLQKYVAVDEKK